MLKDRLVLLEQEVEKLKIECALNYLQLVKNNLSESAVAEYNNLFTQLTIRQTELTTVKSMIIDGYE